MIKILLFVDRPVEKTVWMEDEREIREVMLKVNTGQERIGSRLLPLERRSQYALIMPEFNTLAVSFCEPPVQLSEKMYRALFCLIDGKTTEQIGQELDISEARVYHLFEEIRGRFHVYSLWDVKELAIQWGLG